MRITSTRYPCSFSLFIVLLLYWPAPVIAQQQVPDPQRVLEEVRTYRTANEVTILEEFCELLSLSNVSADRLAIGKNADFILGMLRKRGIDSRLLEIEGAPPYVYGEVRAAEAVKTVIFYAHYDGQPVDASRWASDPWKPVLRNGILEEGGKEIPFPRRGGTAESLDPESRLYARSASDDKAPIIALLTAFDALRKAGIEPSVNVKFFFEGEEEAGSNHIRTALQTYRDQLDSDVWIFCDGPVHQSRRQEVAFGVRGIVGLQMTVFGPLRPLHSGHYGNWAPHPTVMLVHLLAGMRDTDGDVLIEGFYEDVRPVTELEKKAIAAVPQVEDLLRDELGLGRVEGGGARLPERIMLPAMNFSGFQAGGIGDQSKNAIPTEAGAYIDFRLVPDLTPQQVRDLVEAHIRKAGYHIVRDVPDRATRLAHERIIRLSWGEGYPAVRTSMELPVSRALIEVAREVAGESLLEVPTHGGSLPMYIFEEVLGKPLITLPIVNHDNNQHGANENLRLQNLWDGIEVFGQVMARLGVLWGNMQEERDRE